MLSDHNRLQSLVDALPDREVQVAISFLAEGIYRARRQRGCLRTGD
jgi:hypothetical protein